MTFAEELVVHARNQPRPATASATAAVALATAAVVAVVEVDRDPQPTIDSMAEGNELRGSCVPFRFVFHVRVT